MNNIFEKLSNFLNKSNSFFGAIENYIINHQKEIEYIFVQFPKDMQASIDMLAQYEWTLDRNDPFIDILQFIKINKLNISDQQKRNKVDNLIIKTLDDEKVNNIFNSILSYANTIKKRYTIIEEVRFSYLNKKYYSANSLLITLIEGIIISNDDSIPRASKRQLLCSIEGKMDDFCEVLTYKVLEKHFYAEFNLSNGKINSSISRNSILHGYDTDFGNEKVFFKLLLLFYDILKTISESNTIPKTEQPQ